MFKLSRLAIILLFLGLNGHLVFFFFETLTVGEAPTVYIMKELRVQKD